MKPILCLATAAAVALAAPSAHAAFEILDLQSPGGQTFWLVEEPSIPIVSVEIGFDGGTRLDPDGREGLGKFVMSMMNEGSGDMDVVAFANRANDLSARIGFSAERDSIKVSGQFLIETLDEAVDLMATAMAEPRMDPAPIVRVRNQILSGIAQDETEPDKIAARTWYANAFPSHPYGRPSDGTAQSIAAITVEDLRAQHALLMNRANAHVAIVGAVTPEQAGRIVDALLAGLPEGTPVAEPAPADPPPPGLTVVQQDVPQSVAVLGQRGIQRDAPDFIAAYVMNYILGGGGFTSRLTEEVREKRGLAYSVYSYLTPSQSAPLYMAGVQTANERIAESIAVIRAEWTRMRDEGLTAGDLDKAKTYLTGSFPLRFDSNSKIASYLLFVQMEDMGIDYINRRNGLIEAVTLEDVNRIAAELLDPDALSIVVVGQPAGL